jgi:plasmid stabilization system protein ParE
MKVYFRPAAEAEVADVVEWYASNAPQLVARFEDELVELVARLADAHQEFPAKYRTVRQALFRSLPYRLFFVVRAGRIEVLSVIHQSRDPARWP